MYPFIPDDRSMRSQTEERRRRAEHARLAAEARRAEKARSHRPAIIAAKGAQNELGPKTSRWLALATPALKEQGMPSEEIHAILEAENPEVIRRYLELHRERSEERFADQRRTVGNLIQVITAATRDPHPSARLKRRGMRLVTITSEAGTR